MLDGIQVEFYIQKGTFRYRLHSMPLKEFLMALFNGSLDVVEKLIDPDVRKEEHTDV